MARSRKSKPNKKKRAPVTQARVSASERRAEARRIAARLEELEELERAQRTRVRRWYADVAAERVRREAFARTLEGRLVTALEVMQDRVAELGYKYPRLESRRPTSDGHDYEAGVTVDEDGNRRDPQNKFVWKSPWALIGKMSFSRGDQLGYADLFRILSSWTLRDIERRINPKRFARIRVEYTDATSGETDEYQLSETFEWEYSLARAIGECDPSRSRSLATRYKNSVISAVTIWFSSSTERDQAAFTRRRP